MDPLAEFLGKLQSNKRKDLGQFIDDEMGELYNQLIQESVPQGIKTTFDKLSNPALSQAININYYFDHIYVLNLDRRPDRLNAMTKALKKRGIFNWSRFRAIDGRDKPHYDEWSNYRQQRMTYKEKIRYQRKAIGSAGSWAILKSMYHMLKEALERGYKRILVLQDDLLFHKHFEEEFIKMQGYVPKNWKLLYLGATQHNWNHIDYRAKYYFPNGTADGAFAVGIDRSVFRELLDEIVKFDMPVDSGALKVIQRRYQKQCLVIQPNLLIADIRDSDLRNSRNLEIYSQKFRWNLKLYDIPK